LKCIDYGQNVLMNFIINKELKCVEYENKYKYNNDYVNNDNYGLYWVWEKVHGVFPVRRNGKKTPRTFSYI